MCLKSTVSEHPSTVNMLKVQTLLHFPRQLCGHILLSLWEIRSWKMSPLAIFKILGLFFNIFLPVASILLVIVRIYRNQFKLIYPGKKIFLNFLLLFWNLHQILNILNTKITLWAYVFPKFWTVKKVVR